MQYMFAFGQLPYRIQRQAAPSGENGEECSHPHIPQAQDHCSLFYSVDLIVSNWQEVAA